MQCVIAILRPETIQPFLLRTSPVLDGVAVTGVLVTGNMALQQWIDESPGLHWVTCTPPSEAADVWNTNHPPSKIIGALKYSLLRGASVLVVRNVPEDLLSDIAQKFREGREDYLEVENWHPDWFYTLTGETAPVLYAIEEPVVDDTRTGHVEIVTAAEFSPNARTILTTSLDGTCKLWDTTTYSETSSLVSDVSAIRSAHFSPDAMRIVTVHRDGSGTVWDSRSAKAHAQLPTSPGPDSEKLTFSLDGSAIFEYDRWSQNKGRNRVTIWDADSGNLRRTIEGDQFTFSPGKNWIATVEYARDSEGKLKKPLAGTAAIWKANTDIRQATFPATTLAFSPDETTITAIDDHVATVFDLRTASVLLQVPETKMVLYSPDGRTLAAVGPGWGLTTIAFWDLTSRRLSWATKGLGSFEAPKVSFSPDNTSVAVAVNAQATVFDIRNGEKRFAVDSSYGEHRHLQTAVRYSPNGRVIYNIIDAPPAGLLLFSPSGARVAIPGRAAVQFWDALTGDRRRIPQSFSPSAETAGTTTTVWDLNTGERLATVAGRPAAFSLAGSIIVTILADGRPRLWDATTAGVLGTLGRIRFLVCLEPSGRNGGHDEEAAPASAGVEPAPLPRYASLQLFHESAPWARASELSTGELFRENHWYQAEVSVRLKPVGVQPSGERRPLREPAQREDVDIVVTAESDDFKISPRVSKLVLPPKGDSNEQAVFRIMPLRHSVGPEDRLRLRFRLFYQFNLLQMLTFRAGALPAIEYEEEEPEWRPPGVDLVYARQTDANDFDLITPCALHVSIEPDQQQFRMTFTLKRQGMKGELAFPAAVSLTPAQLENAIAGVRKSLFRVCSSETLGKRLEGIDWEYNEQLAQLAQKGRDLWSLLFDRGLGQEMTVIGDWLKTNPLPDGSTIQVSIEDGATAFVFGWGLLYDRPCVADGTYSYQGFWGMRYVVEQRLIIPMPTARSVPDLPDIEIAAMYWKFSQTPDQQQYLLDLISERKQAKLALGGPIEDPAKAVQCLTLGSSQIVYFFTHGYTALPDGERFGVTIQDFIHMYNTLPSNSPNRQAWKHIYEEIKQRRFESDQSWIELSDGKVLLADLYKEVAVLPARPVVILNMCDSAQITPALSQSFFDFFLTRGARAVIGTECSIRPVFADYVGREMLANLLKAVPVGVILRKIRRDAAEKKNLLGLAYTLFGSADAVLRPPPS